MTNEELSTKMLTLYKEWFKLNISKPDMEYQALALIQSFREQIQRETVEKCQAKIQAEALEMLRLSNKGTNAPNRTNMLINANAVT